MKDASDDSPVTEKKAESKIHLFESYAEYVGCDVEQLSTYGLHLWLCDNCDIEIPVSASDPQAYGPVICPECGEICDLEPFA